MFFAHIPAGYLVSRALVRGNPFPLKFVLFAGMAGGVMPDVDLLYLYLLDATPQPHHTYWTHLPIAWLGCTALVWVAARKCSAACRLGWTAFLLGWLSHLLLDTLTGDIWWPYPLVDQPYSLARIEARYQPWWMNYLLHWSMAVEAAIIALAVWLEGTKPRVLNRIKLPKPVAFAGIVLTGLMLAEIFLPGPAVNQPVLGASAKDWHPASFWHPHWGASGVHKGIDIFAPRGTAVLAAQSGWVVYRGTLAQGGRVVAVLSARGWLHYYAHLDSTQARAGAWVKQGTPIGRVGSTGNATGKPPHLHYSIVSPIPKLTDFRPVAQGWKRMFYRNPSGLLAQQSASVARARHAVFNIHPARQGYVKLAQKNDRIAPIIVPCSLFLERSRACA
ncbi:MAG: M23 family metallopeptidase [Gammaproteobacteria bacterium]